jgi:organic hydroperoxide reductase OsmC/OhrA
MGHAYYATVLWQREGASFIDQHYSRGHAWRFDEGVEVQASSSPLHVPVGSVAAAVDPEEAFVAALSSCHMLFFLHLAGRRKFVVERYQDQAVGEMAQNKAGKDFMAKVTLNPHVVFQGEARPSEEDVAALHHRAHEECYLANSVKSEVVVGSSTIAFATEA